MYQCYLSTASCDALDTSLRSLVRRCAGDAFPCLHISDSDTLCHRRGGEAGRGALRPAARLMPRAAILGASLPDAAELVPVPPSGASIACTGKGISPSRGGLSLPRARACALALACLSKTRAVLSWPCARVCTARRMRVGECVCARAYVCVYLCLCCVCVCVQDSDGLEGRSW